MSDNDAVIIKGIRGGLLLLLDDREGYDALLAELHERLAQRESFFRGATMTVNLGRRVVDDAALAGLRDTLHAFEVQIDTLVSSAAESRAAATAQGIANRPPAFARHKEEAPPAPPPAAPRDPDDLDFAALAE